MHDLFHRLLSHYGAGFVGVVVALEAMGLPLPGESLIIAGAVFCATTHELSIVWVITAAVAGAIVGDGVGYLIGRTLGFRLLADYGRHVGLTEDRLLLGRHLFVRYGGGVVFAGRFVAVLRTFAALLAGANRMPWPRFLVWNAAGGTCWAVAYGLGAYAFGLGMKKLQGGVGLFLGSVIVVLIGLAAVYLKRNEHRLIEEARSQVKASVSE